MTLRIIIILAFIIGVGLFFYSMTLPYYKDKKATDLLLANSYKIEKGQYYKREAELRTNKVAFMDLGAGVAIASVVILVFLLLTKTKTFSDLNNLKSLKKNTLFLSVNLVLLVMIPGTLWYYTFRGGRGDYPPFADSIGIPIMTSISFFLFLLIPVNIFLLLTTFKAMLPTRLFLKADNYSRPAVLWEFFFGFLLLINILYFISFVVDGDHIAVIVNLFFTFVLLTLRAGQISRYKQTSENACL